MVYDDYLAQIAVIKFAPSGLVGVFLIFYQNVL
jgi:hypothetical protein